MSVETEMAWTPYSQSCRDLAVMPDGDLRPCRRRFGHRADDGGHASGFGPQLRRWEDVGEQPGGQADGGRSAGLDEAARITGSS